MKELTKLKDFFLRSFDQKTQILIRVALIGVVVGTFTAGLRITTELLEDIIYNLHSSSDQSLKWIFLPLFCVVGGLIAGLITQKIAPDARGSGIPQVKYVLNSSGSTIRLRTAVVKFVGGVLAIGSGLSLGREGPSIQIGAALGSKINATLGGRHRKRAIASGAGAGLAAAFNTPIAGVLFVIEELDKNFSSAALGPAIVASVTAVFTFRIIYGDFFAYHFQSYCPVTTLTLPLFVLLGIISAIIGTYFQRSLLWSMRTYAKYFVNIPMWSWGAIAGLVTGITGIWIPEALGSGHTTLENVLAGTYTWTFIPIIFIAKYLLTMVAYGSRVPGGFFAPALILGAALGSVYGHALNILIPSLNIEPASFAFVGMGAFFTAIARAPITSIIMLFELTGNYQLVLPLMFGCIIANLAAEKLKQGSIYENILENEGLDIKEYSNPSYLQVSSVSDAMTKTVDTVPETINVDELNKLFSNSDHKGFPVLDKEGKLVGIITQHDMNDAFDEQIDVNSLASEIMSKDLITLNPNDSLHSVILKLYEHKIGRILIVDERDGSKLVGIITRSDIINFEAHHELDY